MAAIRSAWIGDSISDVVRVEAGKQGFQSFAVEQFNFAGVERHQAVDIDAVAVFAAVGAEVVRVADQGRQDGHAAEWGIGDRCHRVAVREEVANGNPVVPALGVVRQHRQPDDRPVALFAVQVLRAESPVGRQHDHQFGALALGAARAVRDVHWPVREAAGDQGVVGVIVAGRQPEQVNAAVAFFPLEGGGDGADVLFNVRAEFAAVAVVCGGKLRRVVVFFGVEGVAEEGVEPFVEAVVVGDDFVVFAAVDDEWLSRVAVFGRRVVERDDDVAHLVDGQPHGVVIVGLGLAAFSGIRAFGGGGIAAEAGGEFVAPGGLRSGDGVVANPVFAVVSGGMFVAVVGLPDGFEVVGEADAVDVFGDADVVRAGGRVQRERRVESLVGEVFVDEGGQADGVVAGAEGVCVAVKPQRKAVVEVDDVAGGGVGVDFGVDDLSAAAARFRIEIDAVEAFVVGHEGQPEGIVEGVFGQSFGIDMRQTDVRPVFAVVGFAEFAPFLLFAVDFFQAEPARFARRDEFVDLAVEGAVDTGEALRQADAVFAFEVFQVGFGRARIERTAEAAGGKGFEVVAQAFGGVHVGVFGCDLPGIVRAFYPGGA